MFNAFIQIRYPETIAIILPQLTNNSMIVRSLTNIIRWSKYAKIKHLMFYDPYNSLSPNSYTLLCEIIEDTFKNNCSIKTTYKDNNTNIKEKQIVNQIELNVEKCSHMVISITAFKTGNNCLIEEMSNSNNDCVDVLQMKYFKTLNNKTVDIRLNSSLYTKYYTSKNTLGIPEIVLLFDSKEICLYGFHFSLLENCEIQMIKHNFLTFNSLQFIQIFDKNSHVQKRFGV